MSLYPRLNGEHAEGCWYYNNPKTAPAPERPFSVEFDLMAPPPPAATEASAEPDDDGNGLLPDALAVLPHVANGTSQLAPSYASALIRELSRLRAAAKEE